MPKACADDEKADFLAELAGLGNIVRTDAPPPPERKLPKARAKMREADERLVLQQAFDGNLDAEWESDDEFLRYRRPEISELLLRRLQRGEFSVQAELDLHGETRDVARMSLARFMAHAKYEGWQCIRVIHGKGLSSPGQVPILKRRVARWLSLREEVLAFVSARREQGGTGALLVLLRRKTGE